MAIIYVITVIFLMIACGTTTAANPPTWTILETRCWQLSPTAGQCAVGVRGSFANRDACIAANGGKLDQKAEGNGKQIHRRCEIAIGPGD